MSRLRSTIDSVTKAVGSTDLISKFSRFKPGNATVGNTHSDKVPVKTETLTSNIPAACSPPETTMKEEEEGEGERTTAEEDSDKQKQQVTEKPFVAKKKSTSGLASATNVSAATSTSTVAKQTIQLFHPSALSTNMDETYKTLSNHINSYFGTNPQGEDGENRLHHHREGVDPVPESHIAALRTADHIPVLSPVSKSIDAPITAPIPSSSSENISPSAETPSSETVASESPAQSTPALTTTPKKGFNHYLSYPGPSVQAFVGSYIAPLVPKFRGDSKRIAAAEKEKSSTVAVDESTVDKSVEKADSEEEKAAKAKQQLLSQREKVGCYIWL